GGSEAARSLPLEAEKRSLLARVHAVDHRRVVRLLQLLLAAPAVVVDRLVAGHGPEPGPEGPMDRLVAIECLVHLDEDLLRQVLGLVDASREAVGDAEDPPRVPGHELAPGRLAPGAALRQEVVIALDQRFPLPLQSGQARPPPITAPRRSEFGKEDGPTASASAESPRSSGV